VTASQEQKVRKLLAQTASGGYSDIHAIDSNGDKVLFTRLDLIVEDLKTILNEQ